MDMGSIDLPSIVYTSVDSGEGENFQSDDSADVVPSDDSVEGVQSDDSNDAVRSGTAFMNQKDPSYIAPSLCHAADDEESCQFLLDAASDNGSCAISPAVVPSFALHHHPLASFNPQIAATIANELCSSVVMLSENAVPVTVLNSQHLFLPHGMPEEGTRSPTPSESSSQSSGSQEAVGLLSLHQYQPLCGPSQPPEQMDYAPLAPDHIISKIKCASLDPLNAKLVPGKGDLPAARDLSPQTCDGNRCLVGEINIDARYRDAFYVSWNWEKIRYACNMAYLGVLFALLVVSVSILVKMPQGHDCDPVREWWQGAVAYHVLVPSFKDSNHDGIGDLQGVVSKLDYIEGLGVSMLRLAPIFEHAESHYDTVLRVQDDPVPTLDPTYPGVSWNLTRVDQALGSSSEVQLLAALLHVRGMALLMDLPLGPGLSTKPLTVPGVSSSWVPQDQLSITATLAEVRRAMPHWLRLGVDGFVFPDLHEMLTEANAAQVVDAVEQWRQLLDASPRRGRERILVLPSQVITSLRGGAAPPHGLLQEDESDDLTRLGDSWITDGTNNDTLVGRAWRAAHLLEHPLVLTSPHHVVRQIREALEVSLDEGSPWLLWSTGGVGRPRRDDQQTHVSRNDSHVSHVTATEEQAADQLRSLVGQDLLLMFLPGSSSLYYGDELDVDVPPEMKWLDWASIMTWTAGQRGGFSTTEPWLDLGPLHAIHNVVTKGRSGVAAVSSLAQHKRIEPPLYIKSLEEFGGDYHPLHSSNIKVRYIDDEMLIMERFFPRRRKYIVVMNLGNSVVHRDLTHYYYGGSVVASSHHNNTGYVEFRGISLQPSEVLVCLLDK